MEAAGGIILRHFLCRAMYYVLTNLKVDNTILAYAIIGGASNVKKNFFLYEGI